MTSLNSDHLQSSSPYMGDVADNDIAAILGIVRERLSIVFLSFLVCFGLATIYTFNAKSQYVASTQVMMENTAPRSDSSILQMLIATGKLDVADLMSQIEIIKSPSTIRRLIIQTKLYRDKEIGGISDAVDFESLSERRRQIIVRQVQNRLSVQPVLGTAIIEIRYRSENPQRAADVANAIVSVYRDHEAEENAKKAQKISQWLAERLTDLKEEVRKAQLILEEEQSKGGSVFFGSDDARLRQIELLTRQLSQTEASLTQTQSKLNKVKSSAETLPDVAHNRIVQNLRLKEADLLEKKSILSKQLGPNHPDMVSLDTQIKEFRLKVEKEMDTVVAALESQAVIDQENIAQLKKRIAQYRSDYHEDGQARIRIRDLQTNVETARALLNNFMASYLESQQHLNIERDPVRVITAASSPLSPTFPNKMLVLGLSGITGIFFGLFLALILERVQNIFQTPKQIESMTGLPVYGVLPAMPSSKKKIVSAEYIFARPATALAETVRSLYTMIKLRDPMAKSGGRVVTVTSTLPDEGKTTSATWLAVTAAQSGEKVLIIDADMRRPSIHKAFDIGNAKGVADYLSDRLPLDEVIYTNHQTGVHVMTGKAIPTHALTLLSGERMENMLRRLRDTYDLIVIDAPTSYVFSDARVLAKQSDKTLYIVESKKTRRDVVMTAIGQFKDMNYKDLAVVLTKAEVSKYLSKKNGDLAYLYQMGHKST